MICLAKDKVLLKATPKAPPIVTPATETSAAKKSAEVSRLPVVGHLETRDKIVTIQSGPNGLLYLVKTKDGKKEYYLYPNDQSGGRNAIAAKSDRSVSVNVSNRATCRRGRTISSNGQTAQKGTTATKLAFPATTRFSRDSSIP